MEDNAREKGDRAVGDAGPYACFCRGRPPGTPAALFGQQKTACAAGGFMLTTDQASLFSLMVMALFLCAALFRCSRP